MSKKIWIQNLHHTVDYTKLQTKNSSVFSTLLESKTFMISQSDSWKLRVCTFQISYKVMVDFASFWHTPSTPKQLHGICSNHIPKQLHGPNQNAQLWILTNQIEEFQSIYLAQNNGYQNNLLFLSFWGYFLFRRTCPFSNPMQLFRDGGSIYTHIHTYIHWLFCVCNIFSFTQEYCTLLFKFGIQELEVLKACFIFSTLKWFHKNS